MKPTRRRRPRSQTFHRVPALTRAMTAEQFLTCLIEQFHYKTVAHSYSPEEGCDQWPCTAWQRWRGARQIIERRGRCGHPNE